MRSNGGMNMSGSQDSVSLEYFLHI
jgi:hypothetical protein